MLQESVRHDCAARLSELGKTGLAAIAYDNLDFKFAVGEATLTRQNTFESITTGVVIPLEHGVVRDDLRCARQIAETTKQRRNRADLRTSKEEILFDDIRPTGESAVAAERAMAFQILSIIIYETFPNYSCTSDASQSLYQ